MSDDLRLRASRVAEAESHSGLASWYVEVCQDLAEAHIEAAECGFAAPEPATIEDTRRMLKLLAEEYEELPDIQPMDDQSISICFENRAQDCSIMFVVESDRSGLLIARINGRSSSQRVSDVFKILSLGGRQALDQAGIRRRPLQPAEASSTAPRSRSDPSASG